MYKIGEVEKSNEKKGIFYSAYILICKLAGGLEIIVLLAIWTFIFLRADIFGGFTREQMISYILIGNIIGLISSFFLYRVIMLDLNNKNSKVLIYKPFKYLYHVLFAGFGRNILPFIIALLFNALLLYFLADKFVFHFDTIYISLIIIMIFLAFIIEFLLAYLLKIFIFWTIEHNEAYKITMRLKKFLAGAYFPLSFFPIIFVKISLFFPFAYSFYVPTQLYLKEIDLQIGIKGIGIQFVWVVVLYVIIRLVLWKKNKRENIKKPENNIQEFSNKYITTPIENFDKKE